MKTDRDWVDLLIKMVHDLPRDDLSHKSRHGSAMVYRGLVAGFGFNSQKTHPFQARYRKNPHAIHIHSEVAAIKNSLRNLSLRELSRSTLYVVRIKEDPITHQIVQGMSCPCEGCARCIAEFDIRRVVYTLDGCRLSCD